MRAAAAKWLGSALSRDPQWGIGFGIRLSGNPGVSWIARVATYGVDRRLDRHRLGWKMAVAGGCPPRISMPAPKIPYPPSPVDVPEGLTDYADSYTRQQNLLLAGLFVFLIFYIGAVILFAMVGVWCFASTFANTRPSRSSAWSCAAPSSCTWSRASLSGPR